MESVLISKSRKMGMSRYALIRTQVNYRYDIAGIRNVELSYNDANLDGSFATNEKSGSIQYTMNHQSMTGVAEVLVETHRDGNDNLVKRVSYTFAEDELTQSTTEYNPANGQQTSKTTLTFGHDGHGSVRVVFGASAALLQAFTYAAYGELLAVHDTTGQSVPVAQSLTRMLYSGEATDPNTGMQYLRARWYDTNSGRFATLDPHGGVFENPLTMNKYAYTSGDPISYNDPTGEFEGLAGMMGSMGNMMANFGMRASQGLRMMKLARSLQRYVKLYQKFMNLIEGVEGLANLAETISEFLTDGRGFGDIMADVFNDILAGLGPESGGGTSDSSTSGTPSALSAALSSSGASVLPVTLYSVKRKNVPIPLVHQVKMGNLSNMRSSRRAMLGVKAIYRLGHKLLGNSVSEVIGEYGAWIAMSMMGFNTGGLKMRSEMNIFTAGGWKDNSGFDIVARHKVVGMWAIVEAKGTEYSGRQWGKLSRKPRVSYGGGQHSTQMRSKWIIHNMEQKLLKDNQGTTEGDALAKAWNSHRNMLAAVVATRFGKKKWQARIVYQRIQSPPDTRLDWPNDV